jgi:1-acyl-sn-glycerol-3-phosphate acyltransferase
MIINFIIINFFQFFSLLMPKKLSERFICLTQKAFVDVLILISYLAPTKIIISGDFPKKSESAIVISNHQIYADWIYIWFVAFIAETHGSVKIMLKKSLKWIPIVGWGMQLMDFIFLNRTWSKDENVIDKHISSYLKYFGPVWLLVFPEGTVISQNTREASKTYALKEGLSYDMKYVLWPKVKGLEHCINNLKGRITALYDFTIGYSGILPEDIPQKTITLRSIFIDMVPPEVHINIKRYPIEEINNLKSPFKHWLQNVFISKDEKMKYFFKNQKFAEMNDNYMTISQRNIYPTTLQYFWASFILLIILLGNYK